MPAKIFVRLARLYFSIFSYCTIRLLVIAYPKRNKDVLFFAVLRAAAIGSFAGVSLLAITYGFDIQLPLYYVPSMDIPPILDIPDIEIAELSPQELKQVKAEQYKKEMKEIREDHFGWVVVTLVIYLIVFRGGYY